MEKIKGNVMSVIDNGQAEELSPPFNFDSVYSDSFHQVLSNLNISLVVTSYQSQKLFFIRSINDGIDVYFKTFHRPMGLAVSEQQITVGTFTEIIRFRRDDEVISLLDEQENVDACFVTNVSHTTGMINIHDIAYGDEGLWVTNSSFSCLATIEPDYSFVPRWLPPFISELAPEDRCHLNGMAMLDGKPRYVTTFNQSDEAGAWRGLRQQGTLIDVKTNEVLLNDLVMPHSPRCYQGLVYFCESGYGKVRCFDPNTREVTTILQLNGFVRGMDFFGPLMFVGLSKVRSSDIKQAPPIAISSTETECGIWVINLDNQQVVGCLKFEGDINQIYDVAILKNCCYPELLEPNHSLLSNVFNYPIPEAETLSENQTRERDLA